ncbi:MAG: AAA family ATPase [Anaerolinea sp.]|nr:AAA family ATPase [Anaerolinea sp.]
MITKLRLQNFKNFQDVTLCLGPLTILLGANAAGKSNLRDALRFLHGVGRGYTLADTMGGKYGEGGELQWRGLRGGTAEATRHSASTFTVTTEFATVGVEQPGLLPIACRYTIEVEAGRNGRPHVVREALYSVGFGQPDQGRMLYDSHPEGNPAPQTDPQHLAVRIQPGGDFRKGHVETFMANQPVLTQISERIVRRPDSGADEVRAAVKAALASLGSMRFLDFNLDAIRQPSFPGQNTLGDRGENLSSVLQAIHEDEASRTSLVEWVRELTPMDVADFAFPADQIGRVLVTLREEDGQEVTAYSASDGTLRFLAVLAALLGPEPAQLCFFEELENGLHPARLHLLIDLIERRVARGDMQIVATTHSPQLVRLLNPTSRADASLVYRLVGQTDAHIQRLGALPAEALRVIEQKDVGGLLASGWFENIASFMATGEG